VREKAGGVARAKKLRGRANAAIFEVEVKVMGHFVLDNGTKGKKS
jgi:hypothetical protein